MATVTTTHKPWYRRLAFRISVRGLIVLVLVVGGGLGWIGHRARVQRDAVAAIVRAGGKVSYDSELPDFTTTPPTPPRRPGPKWLVKAIGIDYFSDVVEVQFFNGRSTATDELMVEVGRLTHLKTLRLNGSQSVTDAGLVHLQGLSRLRVLDLGSTGVKGPGLANLAGMVSLRNLDLNALPITDADLAAHLSKQPQLEWLFLSGPAITDGGLAHLSGLDLHGLTLKGCPVTANGLGYLRGMTHLATLTLLETRVDSLEPLRAIPSLRNLAIVKGPMTDDGLAPLATFTQFETLDLNQISIGDAGLIHIQGLTSLTSLDLAGTRITDAGLARLEGLANLKGLQLGNTAITDAGLVHLANLKKLQRLHLPQTAVTDAGLPHLAGLTSCRELLLGWTKVTRAGVAALNKSVPTMRVSY